jgi:tRNA (cytidine56-2'-O)-methyltransferase
MYEGGKYPNRDECLRILTEAGCSKKVIHHVSTVTKLALKIAERFPNADKNLIEAAGLLHDLGRARTHGINHAVAGGELARELQLPSEIINIIERHICAGIIKADAINLGLPARDYVPETIEERIIAHADNLVEDNKRLPISRSVQILHEKGLPEVAKRVQELHKTLSREAGIDLDEI